MTSTQQEHASWATAGSDATAKKTYDSVRAALSQLLTRGDIEVFLQGSYANATNIRADSDVDIVVASNRTYHSNQDQLSIPARARFDAHFQPATYSMTDLRSDVRSALIAHYGAHRVQDKDKCIRVAKRDGYVDADVVPAFQYRHFASSDPVDVRRDWSEGIMILPLSGGRIVNFPKQHIANGQTKNSISAGRYKPTVRQVKRLRNRAIDEGRISKALSPGYLLECMTFNTPADRFTHDHSERLRDVVLWLKYADKRQFTSCDQIHTLFGTDPGRFDPAIAQRVIDALWDAY